MANKLTLAEQKQIAEQEHETKMNEARASSEKQLTQRLEGMTPVYGDSVGGEK